MYYILCGRTLNKPYLLNVEKYLRKLSSRVARPSLNHTTVVILTFDRPLPAILLHIRTKALHARV
jgi:hypothetical protein